MAKEVVSQSASRYKRAAGGTPTGRAYIHLEKTETPGVSTLDRIACTREFFDGSELFRTPRPHSL